MELSPSWEAARCAATQELPNIDDWTLWTLKQECYARPSVPSFIRIGHSLDKYADNSEQRTGSVFSASVWELGWELPSSVGIETSAFISLHLMLIWQVVLRDYDKATAEFVSSLRVGDYGWNTALKWSAVCPKPTRKWYCSNSCFIHLSTHSHWN
jgi:hypothetical protein